ncbi:hypothetical protein SARC_05786 [Sphaeroforma arctica JP610]|uniref:Glycosyltransferase 61 catalytic domain-containing protein n=1 Tax=Sphaeroforma arctica JP610 TaxID=667725 RepID=A0A0L0FYI9_9EUKA|nr:hypothetical protein SARC_05786 [Sphaeroforma arctica JP610]KNC81912.1 hypothetical protein SARC_05786 [Sphaeroforma arctica JP610]|eukprot:XP_014155814.1 hypothetical protein SARC_05786 [Sphaeroforma arctica JP610]
MQHVNRHIISTGCRNHISLYLCIVVAISVLCTLVLRCTTVYYDVDLYSPGSSNENLAGALHPTPSEVRDLDLAPGTTSETETSIEQKIHDELEELETNRVKLDGPSVPVYNDLPKHDYDKEWVKCELHGDESMACMYQTLCYDGGTYYAVVAEKDMEVSASIAGYNNISQALGGDGTYNRHVPDRVKLSAMENMGKQSRPFRTGMQMKTISAEFLERLTSGVNGSISWLPDNSLYLQPFCSNCPHPYYSLMAQMPLWNVINNVLNGIKEVMMPRAVFLDSHRDCQSPYFHFWYDIISSVVQNNGLVDVTSIDVANRLGINVSNNEELQRSNGFMMDKSIIWDIEERQIGKSRCAIGRKDISYEHIVCSRNAIAMGTPNVPVTGAIAKHRLRTETFKLNNEPNVDMQAGIGNTVQVVIVDRGDEGRRFENPEEMIATAQNSSHVEDISINVTYVRSLWDLSIYEQFKLFSTMDVLVMGHGAGETNTFFMKTNSAFIEAIPIGWNSRAFRELYSSGGGYYQSIDGSLNITIGEDQRKRWETDQCQRDTRDWQRSHYYEISGCYQLFKYFPIRVDSDELLTTLQRAYRHLKYAKNRVIP